MKKRFLHFRQVVIKYHVKIIEVLLATLSLACIAFAGYIFYRWGVDRQQFSKAESTNTTQKAQIATDLEKMTAQLQATQQELTALQNEDQVKKNVALENEITNIKTTYQHAVASYEKLLNLRDLGIKTQTYDAQFTLALTQLSNANYATASATLNQLDQKIDTAIASASGTAAIPANLTSSNAPPASGLSRQAVTTDVGTFAVDILTADLNTAKVQIETASSGDCGNNCPVAGLADFVARSGGFAGINGPYFCPAEYPSCVGKTNSFDTLLMNKNKVYFNSANNVYSTVPLYAFTGNSARLVDKSENWGRDTSVDAVMAGQPLLVEGGQIAIGGDSDSKETNRTSRSFIAAKDNFLYIGVVHAATVIEVAHVLKTLGVQSAINLDSAGSTAFEVNGKYIDGPGRDTPFGIVLVRK